MSTLDEKRKPSSEFYRNKKTAGFSIKVTDNLYLTDAYKDSIYNRIGRQDLKSNRYRYSDVTYYVMKKYIEDTYKTRLDKLADDFLYKPLGAMDTSYNPLEKFPKNRIVPTEVDKYYRYQTVQGYVHDMEDCSVMPMMLQRSCKCTYKEVNMEEPGFWMGGP